MDALAPAASPSLSDAEIPKGPESSLTNRLVEFFESRAHPPPSRRTLIKQLLRAKADNSPGYKAFLVQYQRLAKGRITSKHAYSLFCQVRRAEDATMMYTRVEALKNNHEASDAACRIQLALHLAVEWVRRFGETRHTKDWYEDQESLELAEVIRRIKYETEKLIACVHSGSIETARALVAIRQKAWDRQDTSLLKNVVKGNASRMKEYRAQLAKYDALPEGPAKAKLAKKTLAATRELLDHYGVSEADLKFLNETKDRLGGSLESTPPFRKDGIKTLGPFSISGNVPIKVKVDYSAKLVNGTYTVLSGGPNGNSLQAYQSTLGEVIVGPVSPQHAVNYPRSHPQRKLLRIPVKAKKFAFLYPVITSVRQITFDKMSSFDMLLLYGGYVYWDEQDQIIQCNSLWPGTNLQFSSPKRLLPELQKVLDDAKRWVPITLENLDKIGAKEFAWFLPSEFPELSGIDAPHGAFAYKYANPEVNNYFALGSAESVLGTLKVTSMKEIYTQIDAEEDT